MSPVDAGAPVGPVLAAGSVADAVVAALRLRNRGLVVENRGAYLRAIAPGRCVLRRADVEDVLGRAFELPRELETVMPSFQGRLAFTAEGAEWAFRRS